MIVTNTSTTNNDNNQPLNLLPSNVLVESVQLRQQHNVAPIHLRRADSNKSTTTVANNINTSMVNTNIASKQRPNQFQHNVTGRVNSASSPSLLHSVPSASNPESSGPSHDFTTNHTSQGQQHLMPCTFHFVCSRYILFMIYLLLLLTLIVNTFMHFLIFGSNMSIGALFLDVHHRYEFVMGDYDSLDPHATGIHQNRDNWPHIPHRPNSNVLHCDRDSFLSLLDEFYHHPKLAPADSSLSPSFDLDQSRNSLIEELNRSHLPNRSKSYPKIFSTFNNKNKNNNNNNENGNNPEEDQLYYSSSSTSTSSQIGSSHRLSDSQWQLKHNEYRLLIIEVAALILLFVLVLIQIIGLIAVMRQHLFLVILVTLVNSLLFSLLVYVSSFGLIILLLFAVLGGFWFVLQLKFGHRKVTQHQQRLKEDIANEMKEVITQTGARLTPCIHVSMEQYEAMTQQMMMHRYSSPIVYCPHYNESLC